jgi:hypothetical protein
MLFHTAPPRGGESKFASACWVFWSRRRPVLKRHAESKMSWLPYLQLEARAGVGGVAHAGLDVLRRRFDHRDAQRRSVGEQRMGVDVGLHAGEVAAFQQAPLVSDHEVAVAPGGIGLRASATESG